MAWDPDSRSNFFSEPAHQCAVTCLTEISLIVTLFSQKWTWTKNLHLLQMQKHVLVYRICWKCSKWRVCHLLVFKGNKFGEDVQIKKKNTSMTRLHWRRRRGWWRGDNFQKLGRGNKWVCAPPPPTFGQYNFAIRSQFVVRNAIFKQFSLRSPTFIY